MDTCWQEKKKNRSSINVLC